MAASALAEAVLDRTRYFPSGISPERVHRLLADGVQVFVVAGTQVQFVTWCYEHRVSPKTRRLHSMPNWHSLVGFQPGGHHALIITPDWTRLLHPSEVLSMSQELARLRELL